MAETFEETTQKVRDIMANATETRQVPPEPGEPVTLYMIDWNDDPRPEALQPAIKLVFDEEAQAFLVSANSPLAYPRSFLESLIPQKQG